MKRKLKPRWDRIFGLLIIILTVVFSCIVINMSVSIENDKKSLECPEINSESIVEPIEEIISGNVIEEPNLEIEVCNNSSTKTYMSYKAITSKTSKQYKYIQKYMTVNDKGLLVDSEGYIGVALGSYFGDIGSKYHVILTSGIELKIVKIEAKADEHTNNGCEQKWDGSVIEFVIDTDVASQYYGISSNGYIKNGNFNNIFSGEIERIVIIK